MPRYAALLRAVNVGGTGKLPMKELAAMCRDAGFSGVRTYIASGNVVFAADGSEDAVRQALETRLRAYAGKPVAIFVRTAAALRGIVENNPFPQADPRFTCAIFLDSAPSAATLEDIRHQTDEQIAPGTREVYVHYPSGQGRSKLRLPGAERGTSRNMNTVARLAEMAAAVP